MLLNIKFYLRPLQQRELIVNAFPYFNTAHFRSEGRIYSETLEQKQLKHSCAK